MRLKGGGKRFEALRELLGAVHQLRIGRGRSGPGPFVKQLVGKQEPGE